MNEVNYHVVLDLEPEEIKTLKRTALDQGLTVKELIRLFIMEILKLREDKV